MPLRLTDREAAALAPEMGVRAQAKLAGAGVASQVTEQRQAAERFDANIDRVFKRYPIRTALALKAVLWLDAKLGEGG